MKKIKKEQLEKINIALIELSKTIQNDFEGTGKVCYYWDYKNNKIVSIKTSGLFANTNNLIYLCEFKRNQKIKVIKYIKKSLIDLFMIAEKIQK